MLTNSSSEQRSSLYLLKDITVTNDTTCILEALNGLDLSSTLRIFLLIFLAMVGLVGLVGNILTLLALPYVRRKYGDQFSVLQSSTTILLLHLSLCDLLYITVGFTHFIHVLILGIVESDFPL